MVKKEEPTLKPFSIARLDKLKEYKDIDNAKDVAASKDNKKKSIYKYWVYIFKNGARISSFGVNEEEFDEVKLLVRRKEIKGEKKVVFMELYPEPAFDMNTVNNNKATIKNELNKLKQIEKKLIDNELGGQVKEYNYDISDVRILIEQYQVSLESIRHGITYEYFHDVREDGIKVIMYDMENSGLKLIKKVKESSVLTEATESKKIASRSSRDQIKRVLRKRNDKDWQRIAITFMAIVLLALAMYGVFKLFDYNKDREMQFAIENFDKIMSRIEQNGEKNTEAIANSYDKNNAMEQNILDANNKILNQCVISNINNGLPVGE